MESFTNQNTLQKASEAMPQQLIATVLDTMPVDALYLLGASAHSRCTGTIFCDRAPAVQHFAGYYLLVLVQRVLHHSMYECQEIIEQRCHAWGPVTTIVLETGTFSSWHKEGHPFACKVVNRALLLFAKEKLILPAPVDPLLGVHFAKLQKFYREGLNRVHEFIAGAALFKIRQQYNMAAFMLHQATEQGLRVLIKAGTGFHCCTHNLDRLLRYGALASYRLPGIFPLHTQMDKRQFTLLQKAYSESRYKEDYTIGQADIEAIAERVNNLQALLLTEVKEWLKPHPVQPSQ